MISYRKLAIRVLGHPLRVPSPRPASHRVTALALTAAMVAGMAAPAYADTYYIGDGDITITKDETGTQVKQGNNTKTDTDGNIIIKGGKNPEGTTASGGSSSTDITSAPSPAQPKLATPPSEDSDSENEDMVYLGAPKGNVSSDDGNEENENQTGDTTGGEENKNQPDDTTGGEESKNQPDDTTGGEENETDPTKKDQTGGKNTGAGSSDPESKGSESGTSGSAGGTPTTGSETPAEGTEGTESTESSLSTPKSQFTYTGASLKVADANDDEETRNESTTVLERAAENFRSTAENVTNYVICIINKAKGNDNTLNVTLDNVNIKAKNDAALSVEGAGNTTITLKGDNTLTSDGQHAGLEHNEKDYYGREDTGKLTITSGNENGRNTGSLTATGSGASAGIGSVWNTGKVSNSGAGTIEITGGDITAIGASDGAGIGSGTWATGETNITISGTAKINARTDQGGAGIGSGSDATGNTNITISGGTIENAQGGSGGAGIGSGDGSTGQTTVTIKSGTIVEAVGGDLGDGIGGGCGRSNTTVTIQGGYIQKAQGGKDFGPYYDAGDGIHSDGNLTISGGTIGTAQGGVGNTSGGSGIYSKGDLNISQSAKINNATGGDSTDGTGIGGDGIRSDGKFAISESLSGNANPYTIGTAKGGNGKSGGSGIFGKTMEILFGIINQATGGRIEYATGGNGGNGGAGIGAGLNAGTTTINITDGTIEKAEGKNGGAGIGSGYYGRSSTVNISGNAELKDVRGGNLAAGIGSGYDSDKVDVVIDGGTINATGGDSAAGIGSGLNSRSSVTIKSGTVNAKGNQHSNNFGSSGIGGSYADVTISGGTITATGYDTGAGIGGSDNNSSSITITGGTITATGTSDAPAIGGGSVSISNTDAALDITANAPDADNAIQSSDGKTLDKVIQLEENGKSGLVKLVKSGTTSISRLFHNGVYADSHSTSHSPDRVTPEMSEAEKAKYGDIASVHNWKVSDRQEPNCGKDGYIDYICMVNKCGATFRHTLPATGQHTWNEGVVTKKPTCTELGVRTFTCTVCHNTRTEAIEAPGHEYGEWVIDRDATCVKEGSKHRDCIRGDATQTESIPATGQHQWKVLSTTAATCGQDGTVTYQCEVCGDTKTETLNATGQHSYGAGVVTKAATCTETGIMAYTCVVCGDSYTESIPVDKTAHKWDAGVVTKEPTCTADGVRTFTCSACGDTRTEAIKALGHEYGEWVIDRDATCVEQGSKHRDCIRGDDTQTEAIPVSKTHTFGEWVITKEPTCTEKGEKQRSCTVSGCVVTETEELPALGHQWSDWTPVEGDSSREYRICAVCNAVEYRGVSHSGGDSDSSTISTGLRVLDPAQADILQNAQLVQLNQISDVLYIAVTHETASLQGVLSDLTGLRSERIETVVFSTERCTSTLSLSDVAALGAGDTPFTLRHSGSTASFIVGGADHTALLR